MKEYLYLGRDIVFIEDGERATIDHSWRSKNGDRLFRILYEDRNIGWGTIWLRQQGSVWVFV